MSEQKNEQKQPQFQLQKIYLKDISFESPNPSEYFLGKRESAPEINVQLNTGGEKVAENLYEVVLEITVTARAKDSEKTVYLVEIKQAGLFSVANFPEAQLAHMLNTFCPTILFPYAREAVSSMVERGGYPQLLLAPINFDALYREYLKRLKTNSENKEAAEEAAH